MYLIIEVVKKMIECSRCGQKWPRDPALEVVCPTCNAKVGIKCKRPSEHIVFGGQPHASRDRLAMDMGFMEKCPGKKVS